MDFKRNDSVALLVMMWLSRHRYSESQFLKFSVKHQKRG